MTNPERIDECLLCLQEFKHSYQIQACQHAFCTKCFHGYIQTLVETGSRKLEDFRCPREECNQLISEQQLEKELDFKLFSKLTDRVIYQHTVLCPSCQNRSDFMSNEQYWFCQCCYTEICRYCRSLTHEGDCQDNVEYFNEVRATFLDNEDIGYCPHCSAPFLKDENCDHVTCDNPDCGLEFCFGCSAKFSPISNHGENFHRKDCRNYGQYDYIENYSEQCTECSQLGTACSPPQLTREMFLSALIQRIEGLNLEEIKEEKKENGAELQKQTEKEIQKENSTETEPETENEKEFKEPPVEKVLA